VIAVLTDALRCTLAADDEIVAMHERLVASCGQLSIELVTLLVQR
jgi:hypothetical protein